MSCTHYLRKCKLLAPCCSKEYLCRICHDEIEDHSLDRRTVDNIICIQCNKKQEIARNCIECGILFGKYTCLTCRLFDDNEKQQFHCVGCGICRIGGRDNFFHCPKCNICISTSIQETHKCLEDISRRKCPVCLDDLHSSRKKVNIPNCSHMIHKECLTNMLGHGKTSCPICCQSLVNMEVVWDRIDNTIVNTEMPEIYRNYHVNILCRDCHEQSNVIFHVIGLKCGGCGGYNTTRIGGDDPLPEEPINVENLSVNSDDSWETINTEDDETNVSGDIPVATIPSLTIPLVTIHDREINPIETIRELLADINDMADAEGTSITDRNVNIVEPDRTTSSSTNLES